MSLNKIYITSKKKLFKLNRSITGKDTFKTLKIINSLTSGLKIKKIKSGTKVFDWVIPPEWNVKDAYIEDIKKKKLIEFRKNNLHLVGYSHPVNKVLKLKDLILRIHVHKKISNAIPYITSYYRKYWGFCCSKLQRNLILKKYKLDDYFRVYINSQFNKNGQLYYGEYFIPGKTKKELIISTYICHPSMANNELSGPIVSMALINYFKRKKNNISLRFLFIPETIGSIAYISKNKNHLKRINILGGYNLTCIGDEKSHSCIFSKYKGSLTDKCLIDSYKQLKIRFKEYSFLERGSDERQFSSPGVSIPFTSIFRSKYGKYKEYHTSLDDFSLVTLKGLQGGYTVAKKAIQNFQKKIIPISKVTCEPMLSKRNLYTNVTDKSKKGLSRKLLDFLQYSDGKNDLVSISKKIKCRIKEVDKYHKILLKNNLVY